MDDSYKLDIWAEVEHVRRYLKELPPYDRGPDPEYPDYPLGKDV